jgi:hypothetical protein
MNDWITILTFTFPHEAHLAELTLQSEGIEVLIQDELTVQVNNFYSNAIGGVKLQVQEIDVEKAYQILKDAGYIREKVLHVNKFLLFLDRFTSKFPFVGKSILPLRLIVLFVLICFLSCIPFIISSLPSLSERLTKHSWCVDDFIYKGKQYHTNTTGLKLVFDEGCSETFDFSNSGKVELPGFNSYAVTASWKLEKRKLVIYDSDTLSYLYNGVYNIDIRKGSITLESENLTLAGHSNIIKW